MFLKGLSPGEAEPMVRIELTTSPLPRVCSTTELHGLELSTPLDQTPSRVCSCAPADYSTCGPMVPNVRSSLVKRIEQPATLLGSRMQDPRRHEAPRLEPEVVPDPRAPGTHIVLGRAIVATPAGRRMQGGHDEGG